MIFEIVVFMCIEGKLASAVHKVQKLVERLHMKVLSKIIVNIIIQLSIKEV